MRPRAKGRQEERARARAHLCPNCVFRLVGEGAGSRPAMRWIMAILSFYGSQPQVFGRRLRLTRKRSDGPSLSVRDSPHSLPCWPYFLHGR